MNSLKSLLIGLVGLVSACNVDVADSREIVPPVMPAETSAPSSPLPPQFDVNVPAVSIDSVLPFGNGLGHCVAFAVGPRDLMTAAHCLGGDYKITHPVTGEPTLVYFAEVEFHVNGSGFDRARFMLFPESPDFKTWLEPAEPTLGELAVMVGVRNKHYLLLQVSNQRPDGLWDLTSFNGEDAFAGDSGSPVLSIQSGKVIGILSNYGPALTPVYGF